MWQTFIPLTPCGRRNIKDAGRLAGIVFAEWVQLYCAANQETFCVERRVEPGRAQGAGSGMQRFYNYEYMYMCTTARVLRGESWFKPTVDSAGMQRFYNYVYMYMCTTARVWFVLIFYTMSRGKKF